MGSKGDRTRAATTTCTVIGGGVTGLAVALHLLDAGIAVDVLERVGIGAGASGVQPGGVRQQWGTTANCQMARDSFRFYRDFPARYETRAQAQLEQCGYVFAATEDATLAQLARNIAVQHAAGVPSQLLTADEAAELVPSLNRDRVAGAAYCSEDGYFDRPQAVVEAFAELVRRSGGRITLADVRGIERDGDGWSLRLADGSTRTSDLVVVAAGADSAALLRPVGHALPIVREARHLFYSEHIRERLIEPLFIAVDLGLAAKHLADGRVLASDLHAAGDPDGNQAEWRRRIRQTVADVVPILEYVSLPIIASGYYDMTPDGQPIVDELERGLWVAAGFSGHGFMVAPVVGERIAAAVTGGPEPGWASSVGVARLASPTVEAEVQVI
ncbi:MAG: FAD-binding oxidoreductase [Actinomycetota bacterium]